ncbi:MAG: DUF6916 family protein [Methylobacter sp.]
MNTLTFDFFEPHINSTFIALLDGGLEFSLTLAEVNHLPSYPFPGKTREPFDLRFHGENSVLLHQMIHRLRHETLGELEIFIVPIGEEAGHYIYQAVFN